MIFHPLDYVVFNGLRKEKTMKNNVLFDRITPKSDHKRIQRSMERVVEIVEYDWKTIRVHQSGQSLQNNGKTARDLFRACYQMLTMECPNNFFVTNIRKPIY